MNWRSRLVLVGGFLVVAAVCARLGFWQVDRLHQRREANSAVRAALAAPLIVLTGATPPTSPINRRVRATGHYDHAHEIVVRGRVYGGVPGAELVTPLVLNGGKAAVLVNRGFVPSPDAVTIASDSLSEPGGQRVEGVALAIDSGRGRPLERGGRTSWAQLDLAALRGTLPYPIYPFYIRQFPDSALPRFPRRLDRPTFDDGPHLNYAIQWFAFAIIAIVFAGVMIRQRPPSRPS